MRTSLIQPIEIYFQEISVIVDEPKDSGDERIVPSDFDQWQGIQFSSKHDFDIIQEDNRSLVEVKFQLEIPNTDGVKLAYKINISVTGKFVTLVNSSQQKEENILDLTVVNGTSMLYSVVREKLLEITSRMKPGAILLPSFNFMDARPSIQNDGTDQSEED